MRFIIYGAGAVGSIIASGLAMNGYPPIIVGNSKHVEKIRTDGLKIVKPTKTYKINIEAYEKAEEIGSFKKNDVIILTAKSQHTILCLGQLRNAGASKKIPIICCQNSIVNEPSASRIFDNIYGAVISIDGVFLKPGEVAIASDGKLGYVEIGRYPSGSDEISEEIIRCFKKSNIDAHVSKTVMKSKGAKCLLNLVNAFEAITDKKIEDCQIANDIADKTRKEAQTVWKAAGIEWEPMDEYYNKSIATRSIEKMPKGYSKTAKRSSTWQSLAKKKGNAETEQINGDIVEIGKMLGIKTPYNKALTEIMKEMIRNKEKPGKYNVKELERMCKEQENK